MIQLSFVKSVQKYKKMKKVIELPDFVLKIKECIISQLRLFQMKIINIKQSELMMRCTKNIYNVLVCIISFLFCYSQLYAMSFEDSLDDLLLNNQAFFDDNNSNALRAAPPLPEIVVLLNQFGLISLLEEELFEKSYTLNKRDLLDYPLFMFPWKHPGCKTMGYQFFYNQTSSMYFSADCSKISAYLAVSSNQFIEKLQAVLQEIRDSTNSDFNPDQAIEILTLMQHFTVQERRLGLMFNYEQKLDDWRFRFYFPFYLRERNHFVSDQVRAALNRIINPVFGSSSADEEEIFAEEHLIDDRLGLGDCRFEFDRTVCCFPTFKARMGFFTTVPTAFAFSKGLIGSDFEPPKVRPFLDIQALFDDDAGKAAIAQENAQEYLLAALDNLSAMLLDTSLGNNGHFGIGWLMKTKSCLSKFVSRPWAESIKLRSRLSLELLLPAIERRYFTRTNNLNDFTSRNFSDDSEGNDNYNFLVQKLTERLFPYTAPAKVFPGLIFRSTSRGVYESNDWSFFVGSDMYVRSPERITDVYCLDFCDIDIKNAQRPTTYQSKVLAGVAWRRCGCDKEWIYSFNADTTVLSSGIGLDFTLTFNIDVTF